jgi:hypothetical protein
MRIELDQNYGFRKQAWKQYFTESTSSAPATAKRYYFHKRAWINDADHACLNLLSVTQAQPLPLLALTGGTSFQVTACRTSMQAVWRSSKGAPVVR